MSFTYISTNSEWWHGPLELLHLPVGLFIAVLFLALIIYLCFRIVQPCFFSGKSHNPEKKGSTLKMEKSKVSSG